MKKTGSTAKTLCSERVGAAEPTVAGPPGTIRAASALGRGCGKRERSFPATSEELVFPAVIPTGNSPHQVHKGGTQRSQPCSQRFRPHHIGEGLWFSSGGK
jgi:hypothetical protein